MQIQAMQKNGLLLNTKTRMNCLLLRNRTFPESARVPNSIYLAIIAPGDGRFVCTLLPVGNCVNHNRFLLLFVCSPSTATTLRGKVLLRRGLRRRTFFHFLSFASDNSVKRVRCVRTFDWVGFRSNCLD